MLDQNGSDDTAALGTAFYHQASDKSRLHGITVPHGAPTLLNCAAAAAAAVAALLLLLLCTPLAMQPERLSQTVLYVSIDQSHPSVPLTAASTTRLTGATGDATKALLRELNAR